jgi:hypothetical protein
MEFGIVNAECGKGKDSIAECANGNAEMGAAFACIPLFFKRGSREVK